LNSRGLNERDRFCRRVRSLYSPERGKADRAS
jgi:hypothetical protein